MRPHPEFSTSTKKRRIVLHVRTMMASRGVRSVAALQRMLISAGIDISNQQLIRIVDNTSTRLNMDVINGLLNIFQCSVYDLIGEEEIQASPTELDDQHGQPPS